MSIAKKNLELDKLVASGHIVGYHYTMVEEEPGSGMRESERLVLTFWNGMAVKFLTCCSGVMENTSLDIAAQSLIVGFDD